jgi:hypothetical protein
MTKYEVTEEEYNFLLDNQAAKEEYNDPDNVVISLESYTELVRKAVLLECLEAAGVDNWEYYEQAYEDYEESK